jgi:hypothetical protein
MPIDQDLWSALKVLKRALKTKSFGPITKAGGLLAIVPTSNCSNEMYVSPYFIILPRDEFLGVQFRALI